MKKKILAVISLITLITLVFTSTALATNKPKWNYDNIDKIEGTIVKPGKHKVGTKIDAGEYKIFAKKESAHFSLSNDSNNKDIVAIEVFDTQAYITVEDGQFLDLSNCIAVKIDEGNKKHIDSIKAINFTSVAFNGTYKAGFDLPSNEYEVESIKDGDISSWAILNSSTGNDIDAIEVFEGSSYATAEDNQYVYLTNAMITLK